MTLMNMNNSLRQKKHILKKLMVGNYIKKVLEIY